MLSCFTTESYVDIILSGMILGILFQDYRLCCSTVYQGTKVHITRETLMTCATADPLLWVVLEGTAHSLSTNDGGTVGDSQLIM